MPGQRVIWWRGRTRYRQEAEVVQVKKRVLVLWKSRVHYAFSGTMEEDAFTWVRPENLQAL